MCIEAGFNHIYHLLGFLWVKLVENPHFVTLQCLAGFHVYPFHLVLHSVDLEVVIKAMVMGEKGEAAGRDLARLTR